MSAGECHANTTAAFDRRLDPSLTQPVAVAFSGGGDSLAALIATKAWADDCGRPVVALHVDHGLQALSGAWRDFAADIARRLGVDFRALAWTGEKPARGLAAAARLARHGLIAAAARDLGATAVVFGHTADDIGEAFLMRAEGLNLGPLAEWRPSPVWPQGRGVFLLRPLLCIRRAAIRERLRSDGWRWIEDPANDDLRHPRARARRGMTEQARIPPPAPDDADAAALAAAAVADAWGAIRFDREVLRRAPPAVVRRVLAAAMLSAGGGQRPPRSERVDALAARVLGPCDFTATLAGGKLAAGREVLIARDAGEAARGGLAPVRVGPDEVAVWDGRFEVRNPGADLDVLPLRGLMARLDPRDRRRLGAVPAAARAALPLLAPTGGQPVCPILAGAGGVEVLSLVGGRFLAACGAIFKEPRAQYSRDESHAWRNRERHPILKDGSSTRSRV